MSRRIFLRTAGRQTVGAMGVVGAITATTLASTAQAQTLPTVKWRLTSSFPKNADLIFGGAESIAKRVAELSGGRFTIQCFAGGEIVPPLAAMDAVQAGTVECAQTAPYYYFGKDPTFAFGCAMPFGLNTRQQNAWMYAGGGLGLMREFLRDYNIINFPAGGTGAQMGGWFRREIKTVADLKGLNMRIGGLAGRVMERLGAVPQQLPAAEIYAALEKGRIDAAEWVGPYDDEKLGFNKVAKYYYYPGWWEGGAELDLYVNLKAWGALPKEYQGMIELACAEANLLMVAKYDALNPAALKRLYANKIELRPFSKEIMSAAYVAAHAIYDEEAAKNPKFRKVYTSWRAFRADQILWFRVAEQHFDNFMATASEIKK